MDMFDDRELSPEQLRAAVGGHNTCVYRKDRCDQSYQTSPEVTIVDQGFQFVEFIGGYFDKNGLPVGPVMRIIPKKPGC
jgi:hypothetical protein